MDVILIDVRPIGAAFIELLMTLLIQSMIELLINHYGHDENIDQKAQSR